MSFFARVAAAWDRVLYGPASGRFDEDFVPLALDLLEDRRLMSAGLTAVLTGQLLTITGQDDTHDDVSIQVVGNELKIFDHHIEVAIHDAGGDHHALDLSALTGLDIDIQLGATPDTLALDLAPHVSVHVHGGDDNVFLHAPAAAGLGDLHIDAASIHVAAGNYSSLHVELTGQIDTDGDVDWNSTDFELHGDVTLGGTLLLHTEVSGSLQIDGHLHDGGAGHSLVAHDWHDISLYSIDIDGDLDLSASVVTLAGETVAHHVSIGTDHQELAPGAAVVADTAHLHPLTSGSDLHIGNDDFAAGLGLTGVDLDRFDTHHILLGGPGTHDIVIHSVIAHQQDASFQFGADHAIVFEPGASWTTHHGDLTFAGNLVIPAGQAALLTTDDGHITVDAGRLAINDQCDGEVVVDPGATLGGSGEILGGVTVTDGGTLAPGNSPGTISTGTLVLMPGANFNVEVEGVGAGQYDRVNVTGTVTLGGANLNLIDVFAGAGALGNTLTLIDNDGTDAVTGTFAGLANGATVNFNGETWRIYYNGGTGNDVVLTYVPPSVMHVYVDKDYTAALGYHNGDVILDADPDTAGNQTAVIGINAFGTITEGINAVTAGGTVHVADGVYTYSGTLLLTKSVTIDGAGMDQTEILRVGAPTGNFDEAIRITAADVTIKDVELGWASPTPANDYQGYVVVTHANGTTINHVLFDGNYRSAVVFENANDLEVSDSVFRGKWGRGAIRDGDNGSGEHFLITRNQFFEDHYRWGPIAIGPQDTFGTPNNYAYSGEISFNYFGNGVQQGAFQEAGDQNYTVTLTNKGLTSDGVQIIHNTFDWQDANTTNQVGKYVQAAGVYFDPTLSVTSTTVIRDNIFNGFQYNGPQPSDAGPLWHATGGVFGGSLEFDGVNDFGVFQSNSFDVGSKGTLSFWVQMDNVTRRNEFFEGPGDAGFEMQFRTNTGGQVYGRTTTVGGDFVIRGSNDAARMTSVLPGQTTNWHNIQYTWDFSASNATGKMHIYVDGIEIGYISGSTPNDLTWASVVSTVNQLMNVGRDGSGDTTRFFDGQMDDIAWFNSVLTQTQLDSIRTTGVAAGVVSQSLNGNLVAYWDFNSAPVDNVFVDSKNGIEMHISTNGIVPFGPTQVTTGLGGTGALNLDGTDDFATFRDQDFDIGDQGTFSIWVNLDTLNKRQELSAGGIEFQIRNTNDVYFYPGNNGADNTLIWSSTTVPPAGNWANITYTWDVATHQGHIYVNGTEVAYRATYGPDVTGAWINPTNTINQLIYLGTDPANAGRNLDGRIDDVAFFDRALTGAEVSNLVSLQAGGATAYSADLVAYWDFNAPIVDGVVHGAGGTSIDLYLQALPPDPPIYGYGVVAPAGAVIESNLFYDNDLATNGLAPLDPTNRVSNESTPNPLLDPLFQRSGGTLDQYYSFGFGSGAAYYSSEFAADHNTLTPHIGAYQGDPQNYGANDILVVGTDDDDLLELEMTGENTGRFRLTRNVTSANPETVGWVTINDVNSFTFEGFGGDDVMIVTQPDGGFINLPGGVTFNGGTQNSNGNFLDPAGPGGDALVLLPATANSLTADTVQYLFHDALIPAEGHDGTITIADAAMSDGSTTITFTGLDSSGGTDAVLDNLQVDHRTFTFQSVLDPDQTITLSSPGGTIGLGGPVLGNRLASDSGPLVSFRSAESLATIDAGAGNDIVNVDGVGAGFTALEILGGAGTDEVHFRGDILLGSGSHAGDLSVTAETIHVQSGVDIATNGGTSGGDVDFLATTAITMDDTATLAAGDGDVRFLADGAIRLGAITSAGTAHITSNLADILDNSVAETANIVAGDITLEAATGIGNNDRLEIDGTNLAATTVTGDIHVTDLAGGLTLTTLNGVTGVSITGGSAADSILVSAAGGLTVATNGAVTNTGGGDITLAADGNGTAANLLIQAAITAAGGSGNIDLFAGHNLTLAAGIAVSAAGTGDIRASAGTNFQGGAGLANGHAAANLTMQDGSTFRSEDGDLRLEATGDVAVSLLNANSDGDAALGNVFVTADFAGVLGGLSNGVGAITDALGGESTNILAADATLSAATGIGSTDDIQTEIARLTATNSTSGNIRITEVDLPASNPLEILGIDNKLGNVVVQTLDGALTVSGQVATTGAGTIQLTAGDADASGGETLLVSAPVASANGAITLLASGGDVRFTAAGNVTSLTGDVTVTASAAVQQVGSVIDAGSGRISITANGDVTLSRLVTTNSSNDAVKVTSTTGGIQNAAGLLESIDAALGRVSLEAVTGIGTTAEPLRIDAGRLVVLNHTSGDVVLSETNGVTVEGIAQQGPGMIDLSAGGTIVLASTATVSTTGGDIGITAGGGITMQDGSLVDAGAGRIVIEAVGDISVSHLKTTTTVEVTSTAGAIRDSDTNQGIDIEATDLALRAATGIGTGNPLEIHVTNLAAITQAGSLQLTSVSGAALNVTTVEGTTGLTNNDLGAGTLILSHNGTLNLDAPVVSTGSGVVRFTTASATPTTGDIHVNTTIAAATALLDIVAPGSVYFEDVTGAGIPEVLAKQIQVAAGIQDAAGTGLRTIVIAPDVLIQSSTGAVTHVVPSLENFVALQLTNQGVAQIDFDYGRLLEQDFTLQIVWGDGTVDTVHHKAGDPDFGLAGHATFFHTYTSHPDPSNPSAPIPVTVTVFNDVNISFRVENQPADTNTQTRTNAVPGDGLKGGLVYDLSIDVPLIEAPRALVGDTLIGTTQTLTQTTNTTEIGVVLDSKPLLEGRILLVHRLGPDGKPLQDEDGNLRQVTFVEEEAESYLADLTKLYKHKSLDTGKFRIYVQEGDARPLLIAVVNLKNGTPVTGNEATQDRPPTAEADMGQMPGPMAPSEGAAGGDEVPPPPPLPRQARLDEALPAGGMSEGRSLLARVSHYLKNLGLM